MVKQVDVALMTEQTQKCTVPRVSCIPKNVQLLCRNTLKHRFCNIVAFTACVSTRLISRMVVTDSRGEGLVLTIRANTNRIWYKNDNLAVSLYEYINHYPCTLRLSCGDLC
ncbi:hypothetical protein DPMN_007634 [Dreissena polymorpha]|uniref:Uncharacterized protein n=1 Tax=Dreissena polymorpha TaxID=45954 RepID=A0A9D4QS33_DREPO|nr:hypothetical protein DPMN_115012 [Dreissena polymorpha]KAH3883674.1 hypothetical protein DPMN_007634 [Dreissena polymorpha]